MFTWKFWREALERAIKTTAQFALVTLGADTAFNVFETTWMPVLGFAASGFVVSILTSIVTGPMGAPASPSAIK